MFRGLHILVRMYLIFLFFLSTFRIAQLLLLRFLFLCLSTMCLRLRASGLDVRLLFLCLCLSTYLYIGLSPFYPLHFVFARPCLFVCLRLRVFLSWVVFMHCMHRNLCLSVCTPGMSRLTMHIFNDCQRVFVLLINLLYC